MRNKNLFSSALTISLLFLLISCESTVRNNSHKLSQTAETSVTISETELSDYEKYSYNKYDLTYNLKNRDKKAVENSTKNEAKKSSVISPEHLINEFPIIPQMPELPTGCEITAMTMVLNFYGYNADKIIMATKYLPSTTLTLRYDSEGKLYGSDLNKYFLGDPTTVEGYVCGTGAIITAANEYLKQCKSNLKAVDITGAEADELYSLIAQDIPVVVWITIGMQDRNNTEGWYTESGEYVDWSTNDHGAVLIGYTENTVTIADPIDGKVEYDRQQFESVFNSRSKQCVILK